MGHTGNTLIFKAVPEAVRGLASIAALLLLAVSGPSASAAAEEGCLRTSATDLSVTDMTGTGEQERKRSLGPYTMYEQIIYQAKQKRILEWLADDMNEGRATGTVSGQRTAWCIADLYRQYGLEPLFGSSFYQPFIADSLNGTIGRNVAGIVRSAVPSDEYVLISAHYDHLGILNGNTYNGADDNASGVTVLLNLADMFGTMKKTKTGPDKNIIFAALDAKELNMAGSKALVDKLLSEKESTAYTTSGTTDPTAATAADRADSASSPEKEFPGIPKDRIICAINIDQIGTVLEPVHEADTNFVIVLGEKTLRKEHRGLIDMCNRYYNIGLDIDHTFYGSENFTELFYQLSDQTVFHQAGIPALVFTSGFHRHTYKTTDDPDIISYPVMKKRTLLIFYLTMML